jgi:hypothetical protein
MGKLGLGPVGVALTVSGTYLDEAAELERMGSSAVWLPGGQIDTLDRLADLAAATTAGAARQILGEQRALVVDQMVVADTDQDRARQTARRPLGFLAGLLPG